MLRLFILALISALAFAPVSTASAQQGGYYFSPGKYKSNTYGKKSYSKKKKYSNKQYKKKKAYGKKKYKKTYAKVPDVMSGGARPNIAPQKPAVVSFAKGYKKGNIVIDTAARRLYYVLSSGKAYSYPIAVGKPCFAWTGTKRITAKKNWPDWRPPAEMRQRKPNLPKLMTGGVQNPLGAKALYLGSSLYRIHGTNNVSSIGTASSSGCFRMSNGHVSHLSKIAGVGTTVHVVRSLGGKGHKYSKNKKSKKRYSKSKKTGYSG